MYFQTCLVLALLLAGLGMGFVYARRAVKAIRKVRRLKGS